VAGGGRAEGGSDRRARRRARAGGGARASTGSPPPSRGPLPQAEQHLQQQPCSHSNLHPPPPRRFKRYLSNLEQFIAKEGKRGDLAFEWTSPWVAVFGGRERGRRGGGGAGGTASRPWRWGQGLRA
jgi:hypothetical protein